MRANVSARHSCFGSGNSSGRRSGFTTSVPLASQDSTLQKLEDLLRDTRFLTVQRYLRTIYRDPMTGRPEWGLVPAPGGGIMGVYSLSNARPIKTGRFRIRESSFANATSLSDWKFTYEPLSMRIPSPETGSHAGR